MVEKIFTHAGQAHADDLLAVATLLTKFPEAEVHRVSEVPEDIGDAIVLRIFSNTEVIKPGDAIHRMLVRIGSEFLRFLREQKKWLEEAKSAEVFEVKELKVVKLDTNVPIRFVKRVHPDVAIVVQPNQRTPGALTLTRVDDHPRVDFRRIEGKVPAHFVHKNGFMAVVAPEHVNEALQLAIE